MTDLTDEAVKALLDWATPDWCVYSEPEVGLPPSLFAGKIGQSGFGPIEPLQGHDLNLAAAAPDLARALLDARAELAATQTQGGDGWTWNERLGWIGPDGKPAARGGAWMAAAEEKHKRDDPDAPEPVPVDTGPKVGPLGGGASVVAYQNWRGEVAIREIKPICLWFGQTQWHPEDQWFLKAWDVEKQVERDFALTGFVNPKEVAYAIA